MTVSKTVTVILSVSNMDDVRYGIYSRLTTMTENIYTSSISDGVTGNFQIAIWTIYGTEFIHGSRLGPKIIDT